MRAARRAWASSLSTARAPSVRLSGAERLPGLPDRRLQGVRFDARRSFGPLGRNQPVSADVLVPCLYETTGRHVHRSSGSDCPQFWGRPEVAKKPADGSERRIPDVRGASGSGDGDCGRDSDRTPDVLRLSTQAIGSPPSAFCSLSHFANGEVRAPPFFNQSTSARNLLQVRRGFSMLKRFVLRPLYLMAATWVVRKVAQRFRTGRPRPGLRRG
jgi:hypothetical protein